MRIKLNSFELYLSKQISRTFNLQYIYWINAYKKKNRIGEVRLKKRDRCLRNTNWTDFGAIFTGGVLIISAANKLCYFLVGIDITKVH